MHLKYSKGSRQARQRCSALHGVEPNSLTHSVSVERQRGQPTGLAFRRISRMDAAGWSGGTGRWAARGRPCRANANAARALAQANANPAVGKKTNRRCREKRQERQRQNSPCRLWRRSWALRDTRWRRRRAERWSRVSGTISAMCAYMMTRGLLSRRRRSAPSPIR